VRPCLIHTHTMPCPCRAPTMPLCKWLLKATAQHGRGTVWFVWINIGRLSTACGRPAQVWFFFQLPRGFSRLAFRIFPATRRLSRRTWHCRRTAGAQHGICELTGYGTAGARCGMCKLALRSPWQLFSCSRNLVFEKHENVSFCGYGELQ
jgi:hypothetical protein